MKFRDSSSSIETERKGKKVVLESIFWKIQVETEI